MRITRGVAVLALSVLWCGVASAQAVTTHEGLTLQETLTQLTRPVGSAPVGEAIGLAVALEVATTPFGTSSGGFVFRLDPNTGLQARTATTFGPSFTERALTSGEGKVSAGVSVISASYTKLGDLSLNRLQLGAVHAASPSVSRVGTTALDVSSNTMVISGTVGVTDAIDVGLSVPMVKVKLNGLSTLVNGAGDVVLTAKGGGNAAGVGDIAAILKYRFHSFGTELPDPGGLALMATVRMPTGDRESLRGLGVYRTLVSLIFSSGQGRIRPHANAGFEYWNDGVDVVANFEKNPATVTARHQVQYGGGIEFEAAPKLTLIVDLLGRHILGGGKVGFQTTVPPANALGVTSFDSAVALPEGIQKITLAPGLKANLKGNLLLSLNVLSALKDTGLHATFIPVVGLDLTF